MAHEAMEEKTTRQGQISEELGYLEEAIEALTHTIGRVEDRLGPVLRIEDEAENKGIMDKALVPLAGIVNSLVMRVRRQSERLARILERLEL